MHLFEAFSSASSHIHHHLHSQGAVLTLPSASQPRPRPGQNSEMIEGRGQGLKMGCGGWKGGGEEWFSEMNLYLSVVWIPKCFFVYIFLRIKFFC